MPSLPGRIPLVFAVGLALSGCVNPAMQPKPSLPPPQMSADSVAMDVVFVRFPLGDAELNGKLWDEVDEQHFPAELRQELARNGFRVGVIGNQVPAGAGEAAGADRQAAHPRRGAGGAGRRHGRRPAIRCGRHLQMRAGSRNEILASGVYEQMPVLVREGGELRGQTYSPGPGPSWPPRPFRRATAASAWNWSPSCTTISRGAASSATRR